MLDRLAAMENFLFENIQSHWSTMTGVSSIQEQLDPLDLVTHPLC